MESVNEVFIQSLGDFIRGTVNFIPNLLVMFVVILIGVILSAIVKFSLNKILIMSKFDQLAEGSGLNEILNRGGVWGSHSHIVASLVSWIILFIFFMMGFVALDIMLINEMISGFISYLPNVFAAVIILILGIIFGKFAEKTVLVTASNADIIHANILAMGTKIFLFVMAGSMALEQLGIARGIIIAAFSIFFGGIVFAVALAFGLAAQDVARKTLEERLKRKEINDDET